MLFIIHKTGAPYQAMVLMNDNGEYSEEYEPISDSLISDYLEARALTGYQSKMIPSVQYRNLRLKFPFAPNLSNPEL